MHIPVPIHDRCLPSQINLFHAASAYKAWTEGYVASLFDHADRLIAAGVVLARQPYVDPPLLSDPPDWMFDVEEDDYLANEPDPEIFGWGPVYEKSPAADEDDEVEIAEEDEAGAILRAVEEES